MIRGGRRTLCPLAAALHLIPRRHHFPARELPQSEQDHGQRTGLQNEPQHPAEKPAEVIRRPIARTHPHIDRKRLAPIPLGDGSSRMGWVGRRNGRRARRGLARCVRRWAVVNIDNPKARSRPRPQRGQRARI